MLIENTITKVKASEYVRIDVDEERRISLSQSLDGTWRLALHIRTGGVHYKSWKIFELCKGFKRLGNVNRYARCYGYEFVK